MQSKYYIDKVVHNTNISKNLGEGGFSGQNLINTRIAAFRAKSQRRITCKSYNYYSKKIYFHVSLLCIFILISIEAQNPLPQSNRFEVESPA